MSLRRSERIAKLYNNKPTYYKEILNESKSVKDFVEKEFVIEKENMNLEILLNKSFNPEKSRKKSKFIERFVFILVLFVVAKTVLMIYFKKENLSA